MKSLRFIHLLVGLIGVVVFLLSGQYMEHMLGKLAGMDDGPRMIVRSAHIYLLWSSLLNLTLGCYMTQVEGRILRILQCLGSIALLAGPSAFCLAFFYEPYLQGLARPFAAPALYAAFVGSMLHTFTALASKRNTRVFDPLLGADSKGRSA